MLGWILLLCTVSGLPSTLWGIGSPPVPEGGVKTQWFKQRLDHTDPTSGVTFMQRYYVNDTYWDGTGPVFLCVGGETPLTGMAVVSSYHCNNMVEWAPDVKALLVAVEHRYYGESNPLTTSFKYLTSEQALADLSLVVPHVANQYHVPSSTKWISWGGSYPGMLAGWFHLKYPKLVHAAVASSAPVLAQIDYKGYNDVVASAFTQSIVGGSAACHDAIKDGHATIGKMLKQTGGPKELESMFHLTMNLSNPTNQANWAGSGVADFPAQSNDPTCQAPYCNIKKICTLMADSSQGTPLQRLVKLAESQRFDFSTRLGGALSWPWQTCREFGFYQTCEEGSQCFFTQGLNTLPFQMGFCETTFKMSVQQVKQNIAHTNSVYGGNLPNGTRILFPNGSVDPWHAASVLPGKSPNPAEEPTIWVDGASHHAWTHPSASTDQPTVVAARLAIRKQVTTWLHEA